MDGHERVDVIEGCRDFLKTMGILNENNAPSEEVGLTIILNKLFKFEKGKPGRIVV